ncbi:MAG: ABC transporter ATP-binding protein [Bradyrhizobium sp.]|jgi:ABC-2 type transport system ATP-binding protein|uniref:ABC transporter ATP-binding protein n=2 Tax=Bradyrhizobium TaxID=374 RepID=A0ABS5G760_9BRAD|nr:MULTISPECIES: ABC transporter ATP-binding protein [Bradyrhizobium]RTM00084.1 MAG: ABC transporter ATP-binding protein [Bradyrhizobiaceae bacterium]ABQ37614.1 putative O-antigen/LPS export system ATP-binding protein [Bradyrhizobium sp. BTAi1]MBR1137114.1 ABC transporter ATP-binding protein [Bradyrhizobium denitrificans]MCL8483228.1 ABC transporter ATP-binding protein [Bradyrhizobium denitrificans]MDU1495549.1 ABC transporter ATP-binding protein [Bradyrhizobium sp.]
MPLIEAKQIGIEFPVAPPNARSFRHLAIKAASRVGGRVSKGEGSFQFVQALDEISFSLKQGDRLGLVGHNGAGKTTLIRVLAGIYEPTRGSLRVVGRNVPMFDIGLGMDEEASGYENIRTRGLILGLSPEEIEERVPEIAEFAELGDYLELPIRTYSSGMLLRLVFSIAASIHGDIILMDEWIAVGDAQFRKKTHDRLQQITQRSGIVVLASHDFGLLRETCNLGLYLDGGRVRAFGALDDVLKELPPA